MTEINKTTDGNLPDGTVAVVVVAAGSGERLGSDLPKAFVELGGETLLEHAVGNLLEMGRPTWLVIVAPKAHVKGVPTFDHSSIVEQVTVAGGATRHESVATGLAAIPDGIEYALIHDAARALTPSDVFVNELAALESGARAVIPALPVVDTIKQVKSMGNDEYVIGTPDRANLRAIQTPQGFKLATLRALHANAADADVTDDAGLAEQAGVEVKVIPGSPEAFKITTPGDLDYARFVLSVKSRESS